MILAAIILVMKFDQYTYLMPKSKKGYKEKEYIEIFGKDKDYYKIYY